MHRTKRRASDNSFALALDLGKPEYQATIEGGLCLFWFHLLLLVALASRNSRIAICNDDNNSLVVNLDKRKIDTLARGPIKHLFSERSGRDRESYERARQKRTNFWLTKKAAPICCHVIRARAIAKLIEQEARLSGRRQAGGPRRELVSSGPLPKVTKPTSWLWKWLLICQLLGLPACLLKLLATRASSCY